VSLRIQQLLAYESGVTETIDPLAGSYYVEYLTNEIEKKAMDYIRKIDEMGGAPTAIEMGYIQKEILEGAYRYQKEIESEERILIGVNKFKVDEHVSMKLAKIDPRVEIDNLEKLKKIKARRDNLKVEFFLEKLKEAAQGDANLMYPILDAVKTYATLGEICSTLREVFGEYKGVTFIYRDWRFWSFQKLGNSFGRNI
jgi:methylmalonyl-CoA mutase N-terminal domain/subunit